MAETQESKPLKRLDKINTCLICGASKFAACLNSDHFYPRCVANKPEDLNPRKNPFRSAIYRRANIFRVCMSEHEGLDKRKIKAFSTDGFKTLDPEGLVAFLMEEYPITNNIKYLDLQLRSMIDTNLRFVEIAYCLNGELPKDLVNRYHKAADLAWEFIRKLEGMRNISSCQRNSSESLTRNI